MEYKVFYYQGEKFGISTIVKLGTIVEDKKSLVIKDKKDEKKQIEIKSVKDVKKTFINGVGDILRVEFKNNADILYLAAYKGFCVANFFVRIDDEKTEEIEKSIVIKK